MIYAECSSGKRWSATEYQKKEQLKDAGKIMYCPGCKEPVFFKNGKQKIPHFAHYSKSCCSFSEGETKAHLLGKLQLLEWFQEQGIETEMEAWLPELQQRPDLLVYGKDGRKIAVEYQCSPIPLSRLLERTEGYQSAGYGIVWICGKEYLPQKGWLTDKQTRFFTWSKNSGAFLCCFDSEKGTVCFFSGFCFNEQNQLSFQTNSVPLREFTVGDWERMKRDLPKQRKTEKKIVPKLMTKQARLLLLHKKDPVHRKFLELLYVNRLHLEELPDEVFRYPHKDVFYHTPAYIWKTYFLLWLQQKGIGETVSIQEIESCFSRLSNRRLLTFRSAPFIPKAAYWESFFSFFNELVHKQQLSLVGNDLWQIKQEMLPKMKNT